MFPCTPYSEREPGPMMQDFIPFEPKVTSHLNFESLVRILLSLPSDAQLSANDDGEYPALLMRASSDCVGDIELDFDYKPVRVCDVLGMLFENEGMELVQDNGSDSGYRVMPESYVWIGRRGEAVSGVSIRDDGSYTFRLTNVYV